MRVYFTTVVSESADSAVSVFSEVASELFSTTGAIMAGGVSSPEEQEYTIIVKNKNIRFFIV